MRFVVAGTDTDAGKTVVSALIVRGFMELGRRAIYQKWVTTGSKEESLDARMVAEFSGLDLDYSSGSLAAPFCFSYPASPHLAAELDGACFDAERAIEATYRLASQGDVLVVEGVGGLMVPLTRELLLIDLIGEAKLPVALGARAGLGTINHTLLSLEALSRRGIPVLGVIFNRIDQGPEEIVQDNRRVVEELGRAPILATIPHLPQWPRGWDSAKGVVMELVRRLLQRMEEFDG